MKSATLQRLKHDLKETLGTLQVFGDDKNIFLTCDTLEPQPGVSELNKGCIPAGTYTCHWSWMNDLQEYHFEILNVSGRTNVFIHEGNTYRSTLGCVLCGNSHGHINGDEEVDVLNSKKTLLAIETFMNKEDFMLTIVDANPVT